MAWGCWYTSGHSNISIRGFETLKYSSRTDREQRRAQIKLDRVLWQLQQMNALILQLARK